LRVWQGPETDAQSVLPVDCGAISPLLVVDDNATNRRILQENTAALADAAHPWSTVVVKR